MKQNVINAAGYVRVSTEGQAENGKASPEVQKEAIQRYAQDHSLQICRFYEDHESGKKVDRTHYLRMKEDAKAGQFKKVLFQKWDRFGRSTKEVLTAHDEMKEIGVDIVCTAQNIDTSSPHGRFFMTNLAAFAEMELAQIRERTIMGLKARAQKGLRIGMGPFGYYWNEKTERFEIDPEESKTYKRIVHDYLAGGRSQTQIAGELNKEGIKSSYRKKWTQVSVKILLTNPAYKGTFRYIFQGREYDVPCPPLIDSKKWDAIQQRAKDNLTRSRNYDKKNDPFLLRNLLRCGECGYGMYPDTVKIRGQSWRYYVCYVANMSPGKRNSSNVETTCNLPTIPAEELENFVMGSILNHFMFPENLVTAWAKLVDSNHRGDLQGKLKSQKIRLGKLESKRNEYWNLFNEDEINKEELTKREKDIKDSIERLKMEVSELDQELALIASKEESLKLLRSTTKEIKKLAPRIKGAIKNMTNQQMKGFLQEALAGEKLSVHILRRRNVIESEKGMTPEELNEPILSSRKGPKTYDWKIEGMWQFDLRAAAQYIKPLIELINER